MGDNGMKQWGNMIGIAGVSNNVFDKANYLMFSDEYSSANKDLRTKQVKNYNEWSKEMSIYSGTEAGKYMNMVKGLPVGQVDMSKVRAALGAQQMKYGPHMMEKANAMSPEERAQMLDYTSGDSKKSPFDMSKNHIVDLDAFLGGSGKGKVDLSDYKANFTVSKTPPVKQKEEPDMQKK
jgi:hypothetical protein